MNTQQKRESLGKINRLRMEIDAEVAKWESLSSEQYDVANDVSGDCIDIDVAILKVECLEYQELNNEQ